MKSCSRKKAHDGAYFLHREDKIGSLEVGKLADIVVLGEGIRRIDVEKPQDVKIYAAMVDGRITHRDGI